MHDAFPFPGRGKALYDFAGVVTAVSRGVDFLPLGDEIKMGLLGRLGTRGGIQ
jgi:hypothetical protein